MKKILFIILFIIVKLSASAQVDPHLSQYYVYPSWLNPALTGAFDGDYRVSAVYRNQWSGLTDGFSTAGVSADMVGPKNLNFGASVIQQSVGTGYSYLSANASIAYTGLKFDDKGYQRIVFGLQGGIINRSFDASKFQFGEQWDPSSGYNPGVGASETFANMSSSVFDVSAGAVYYDANPDKKANIFFGFSASHLTQPKSSFYTQQTEEKLPLRYTIHGGVKLTVSDFLSIVPNALYLRQGNAEEKMVGAYAQMDGPANADILLGANYRFKDAFVPYLGMSIKSFVFGFSYDLNNSELSKNISNVNSTEISLSYIIRRSKTLGEKHFICPRF